MTDGPARDGGLPPIVVVLGRDKPHEVAFNVWAVILGVLFTAGVPRPGSLASLVNGPAFYVFSIGLLLGGLVALAGSHWNRDVERSLEIERAGLLILTGALVVYTAAVVTVFGWQALIGGGLCATWMYANVRRSVTVTRDLRAIRRKVQG